MSVGGTNRRVFIAALGGVAVGGPCAAAGEHRWPADDARQHAR